jgi:hypothetical protein
LFQIGITQLIEIISNISSIRLLSSNNTVKYKLKIIVNKITQQIYDEQHYKTFVNQYKHASILEFVVITTLLRGVIHTLHITSSYQATREITLLIMI